MFLCTNKDDFSQADASATGGARECIEQLLGAIGKRKRLSLSMYTMRGKWLRSRASNEGGRERFFFFHWLSSHALRSTDLGRSTVDALQGNLFL